MRIFIPSPLYSYTAGRREVPGRGATLAELLADLDARYPGIRFRIIDEQGAIRTHIRFFVNGEAAASIAQPVRQGDEVHIIAALSGGL